MSDASVMEESSRLVEFYMDLRYPVTSRYPAKGPLGLVSPSLRMSLMEIFVLLKALSRDTHIQVRSSQGSVLASGQPLYSPVLERRRHTWL